ncbi:glycosyltransferase [Candidatus Omnitrophota bacterium]
MKILLATGRSGGHIFPALALIDAVKGLYPETEAILLLPESRLTRKLDLSKYKVRYLSDASLSPGINPDNIIAVFQSVKSVFESFFFLVSFRPDVVIGFGSKSSIACLMLAWLFRIETLIHEQNVVPGRANMLLAKFADKVAISFERTRDYLKVSPKKIIYSGNPLRPALKQIEKSSCLGFFSLQEEKITLLVLGGSQGSDRVNSVVLQALREFPDRKRLQVIHMAGDKVQDSLRAGYADLGIRHKVFGFFNSMQFAYSAADIVISRAGATTLAEIIYFRIPAILLPYPFAQSHQSENARVLGEAGAARVIEDEALNSGALSKELSGLLSGLGLSQMRSMYQRIKGPGADKLLAEAVLGRG